MVRQELAKRFEGDALRAGLVLVTVARLQKHNESLPLASRRPASINRAISVIENAIMPPSGAKQRGAATGNATMKSWVAWRSMSPIWAGLIAAANFDLSMAALFQAAWTDDGPKRVAAYGKWFARVAGHLKPANAKGVLLPAEEAVLIDVGVEEMEPTLSGLTPLERKFAQEYRA